MIDLNNKAFQHSLIYDISIAAITTMKDSDSFVYIIIERYSTVKFYEIMIDTSTSCHFTMGYDQYLMYEKYYDSTLIDT